MLDAKKLIQVGSSLSADGMQPEVQSRIYQKMLYVLLPHRQHRPLIATIPPEILAHCLIRIVGSTILIRRIDFSMPFRTHAESRRVAVLFSDPTLLADVGAA